MIITRRCAVCNITVLQLILVAIYAYYMPVLNEKGAHCAIKFKELLLCIIETIVYCVILFWYYMLTSFTPLALNFDGFTKADLEGVLGELKPAPPFRIFTMC